MSIRNDHYKHFFACFAITALGTIPWQIWHEEWSEAEGLARMIDGELVLGKTELEKADELLVEQQALLNDPILRLEALEGALLDIITGGIEND